MKLHHLPVWDGDEVGSFDEAFVGGEMESAWDV